jgi:hypothetical protein
VDDVFEVPAARKVLLVRGEGVGGGEWWCGGGSGGGGLSDSD